MAFTARYRTPCNNGDMIECGDTIRAVDPDDPYACAYEHVICPGEAPPKASRFEGTDEEAMGY